MGSFESARHRMVRRQLRGREITDERVLAAMTAVPRERFVSERFADQAHDDVPLPIGFGQTISQPYMVALTCQAACVRRGDCVLDVGCGSGYQAAVLAELGAEVYAAECIPELADRAAQTLTALGLEDRVTVRCGDGSVGLPEHAPFDAITVGAAAPRFPVALFEQLRVHGRMVVPIGSRSGQWLEVVSRSPEGPVTSRSVPCRFVPLVGAEGFQD